MSTRAPALQFMADRLGETLVALENYSRMTNAAPRPYSTKIGRGNRDAHLSAEWLCSTLLAVALGDPKNAASKVPAFGSLRLDRSRFARHETIREGNWNSLNHLAPTRETVTEIPGASLTGLLGETVFETLVNLVEIIASERDGEFHRELKKGFRMTLTEGQYPSAEIALLASKDRDVEWWHRCQCYPASSQAELPVYLGVIPIRRQAVILVEHIEMLASLYADTLKHRAANEAGSKQPASAQRRPLKRGKKASNENAAPGRAAPSRNQDQNSIPEGDTPEIKRERKKPQAQSSRGSGSPRNFHRNPTHESGNAYPALAPVA